MQQITKRQIQVFASIAWGFATGDYKELAAQQNVSVRTIKYDLDTIRLWLKARNQDLTSKEAKVFGWH